MSEFARIKDRESWRELELIHMTLSTDETNYEFSWMREWPQWKVDAAYSRSKRLRMLDEILKQEEPRFWQCQRCGAMIESAHCPCRFDDALP